MDKERLEYIDQIKGFAIITIVWAHCGQSYFFDTIHYLLSVFIIVTGMLLRHGESYKRPLEATRKSFGRLMYPFFMFGLISIYIFACMNSALHTELSLSYRVKEIFTLGYDACWFLPALFIGQSIAVYVIYGAKKSNKETGVILSSMIAILSVTEVLRHILWGKYSGSSVNSFLDGKKMWMLLIGSRSLMFCFFVLAGYVIFPWIEWIRGRKKVLFLVVGLFFFGAMVLVTRKAGFVDLRLMNWNNTLVYVSCSLLVSLSVIVIFAVLPVKSRWMAFLGKNSLIIMGVHMSMQRVWLAARLLENYVPTVLTEFPTAHSVVHMILTLMLTIPEIYIFNKAFPFMVNWQAFKRLCAGRRTPGAR